MKETLIHTPGPWMVQADPVHAGKHPLHESRYVTTKHRLEAIWPDPADGRGPEVRFMEGDGEESIICTMTDAAEQKANALLIAAAPELLLALRALRSLVSSHSEFTSQPAYLMADQAINKAFGKGLE